MMKKNAIIFLVMLFDFPIVCHAMNDIEVAQHMGLCYANYAYLTVALSKSDTSNNSSKIQEIGELMTKAEKIGSEKSQPNFKKVALNEMKNLKNIDPNIYIANSDKVKKLITSCTQYIYLYPGKQ